MSWRMPAFTMRSVTCGLETHPGRDAPAPFARCAGVGARRVVARSEHREQAFDRGVRRVVVRGTGRREDRAAAARALDDLEEDDDRGEVAVFFVRQLLDDFAGRVDHRDDECAQNVRGGPCATSARRCRASFRRCDDTSAWTSVRTMSGETPATSRRCKRATMSFATATRRSSRRSAMCARLECGASMDGRRRACRSSASGRLAATPCGVRPCRAGRRRERVAFDLRDAAHDVVQAWRAKGRSISSITVCPAAASTSSTSAHHCFGAAQKIAQRLRCRPVEHVRTSEVAERMRLTFSAVGIIDVQLCMNSRVLIDAVHRS